MKWEMEIDGAAVAAAAAAMLPLFNLWPPAAPLWPIKARGAAQRRLWH